MTSWRDRSVAALSIKKDGPGDTVEKQKASRKAIKGAYGTLLVSPLDANVYVSTSNIAEAVLEGGSSEDVNDYVTHIQNRLTVNRTADELSSDELLPFQATTITPYIKVNIGSHPVYRSHCGILGPTTLTMSTPVKSVHEQSIEAGKHRTQIKKDGYTDADAMSNHLAAGHEDLSLLCHCQWFESVTSFLHDPRSYISIALCDYDMCSDVYKGKSEIVLDSRQLDVNYIPRTKSIFVILKGSIEIPPLYVRQSAGEVNNDASHHIGNPKLQPPIQLFLSCRVEVSVMTFGVLSEISSLSASMNKTQISSIQKNSVVEYHRDEADIEGIINKSKKLLKAFYAFCNMATEYRSMVNLDNPFVCAAATAILAVVYWEPLMIFALVSATSVFLLGQTFLDLPYSNTTNSTWWQRRQMHLKPGGATNGNPLCDSSDNQSTTVTENEGNNIDTATKAKLFSCSRRRAVGGLEASLLKAKSRATMTQNDAKRGEGKDVSNVVKEDEDDHIDLGGGFVKSEIVTYLISRAYSDELCVRLNKIDRILSVIQMFVNLSEEIILWKRPIASLLLFTIGIIFTMLSTVFPKLVVRSIWRLLIIFTVAKVVCRLTPIGTIVRWCWAIVLYCWLALKRKYYGPFV